MFFENGRAQTLLILGRSQLFGLSAHCCTLSKLQLDVSSSAFVSTQKPTRKFCPCQRRTPGAYLCQKLGQFQSMSVSTAMLNTCRLSQDTSLVSRLLQRCLSAVRYSSMNLNSSLHLCYPSKHQHRDPVSYIRHRNPMPTRRASYISTPECLSA